MFSFWDWFQYSYKKFWILDLLRLKEFPFRPKVYLPMSVYLLIDAKMNKSFLRLKILFEPPRVYDLEPIINLDKGFGLWLLAQ